MNRHFGLRTLKLTTASALALGLAGTAQDSFAASASANATAQVVTPIAITKNNGQDLSFGKFAVSPTGGSGSITINPQNNARSKTGNVMLLQTGGSGSAAGFTVSGDNGASYAITLPSTDVTLSRAGGGSMIANNFSSQPSNAGTLNGSGSQQLTVGATLNVEQGVATGSYTGSFDVTVDYN